MNGVASSILNGIDNVGKSFVTNVYMQLNHALGGVLVLMLTVYVVWWGYLIVAGRDNLSPIEAMFRLGRVGVIYMFVTQWGTFSNTIYVLVQSIPDEVGKIVIGAVSRATGNQLSGQSAIPALIDNLYKGAQDVASQVYTGSFYDIMGALLSVFVLAGAIIFSAICVAAIIAAKVMLFITVALAPLWILMWMYKWSTRISEGFISLCTYLIITQIVLYGFLGFYFSLVNLALSTATGSGDLADNKMSMVMPFIFVTVVGIFILTQIPSLVSILNGGGFVGATGAISSYVNFARNLSGAGSKTARGSASFLRDSARGRQQLSEDLAARKAIQSNAQRNSTP
ncbi:type IV secretion system protein [Agrobacterium tumefaciens]|uniref:type IV secretion system protein n=1 Tax=Agrobacterium tumefaciens TaxID=358 RepID=UPI0015721F44|nr:type IV secretion system protein [Agrobacterium tumefaciens]NTE37660.1 type IV secretion system protein [Agrobacterium tumefaciens]NTE53172.1 type IV secretion system protein [Agrobacterium tumefaciens]